MLTADSCHNLVVFAFFVLSVLKILRDALPSAFDRRQQGGHKKILKGSLKWIDRPYCKIRFFT